MNRSLVALLFVAGLGLPGVGHAWLQEGETPVRGNMSMGADVWFPTNPTIREVYGSAGKLGFRFRGGVVWFKKVIPVIHLETNAGFGFTVKKAGEIGVLTGEPTPETAKLTILPMDVEMLLGIDAFPEQILVPYAAVGLDMVPWNEASSSGDKTKGVKFGWHFRAGLAILLDPIEPLRAGQADARMGVNDFYLTAEANSENVPTFGRTDGLNFGGWSLRIGLKFVL